LVEIIIAAAAFDKSIVLAKMSYWEYISEVVMRFGKSLRP
jgi:hypothetical protein